MSSSTNFRRIVGALPGIGSRAIRLLQRVSSLEAQLADLRATLATRIGTGNDGKAADADVQAMLIRAAAVAGELDRLQALYESLAMRIAQQESAVSGVVPHAAAAPATPTTTTAPTTASTAAPVAAPLVGQHLDSGTKLVLDPRLHGTASELSPAGRQRHEALVAEWMALVQPSRVDAGLSGVAGRVTRAMQSATRAKAIYARVDAQYGQMAKEYALKIDAVERLTLECADLERRIEEFKVVRQHTSKELEQLEQLRSSEEQSRVDLQRMLAELDQTRNEYRKTVDAHERLTNRTNELLRNVQEESRTAGLRSTAEAKRDLRRPGFPSSLAALPGLLPINVVDVGAQMLSSEGHIYAPMQALGACEIVGFEPLEDAAQARAEHEPGVRMLPFLIGNGQKGRFHVTRFDPTSSLLEPDTEFISQFMALPQMCEPTQVLDVDTVRLDDVADLGSCDYLKLDVQGGELDVLKGASRALQQAVVVHTEVEFAPIYRGQPLFADIDTFMRGCGFELIDLMKFGYAGYTDLPSRSSVSRLMWCEAVYFKRRDAGPGMSPEKLLKAAFIAHVNYGMTDLAANCLAHYDRVTGRSLAQTYVEALSVDRENDDRSVTAAGAGRPAPCAEPDMSNIVIEVAPGELIDRLSILEIKLERIKDEAKLKNIRHEYEATMVERGKLGGDNAELERLAADLKAVNEKIWEIEDDIRDHERARDFGESFVAIARSVYQTNDKRAELKRRINELMNSKLVEEKSYAPY